MTTPVLQKSTQTPTVAGNKLSITAPLDGSVHAPTPYGVNYWNSAVRGILRQAKLLANKRDGAPLNPAVLSYNFIVVGHGSGIGPLALCMTFRSSHVTTCDTNLNASDVLRQNMSQLTNKFTNKPRFTCYEPDTHRFLPNDVFRTHFNAVFFNPPQRIVPPSMNQKDFGGTGGVDLLHKFLTECKQRLSPGTSVYFPTNSLSGQALLLILAGKLGELTEIGKYVWDVSALVDGHLNWYQEQNNDPASPISFYKRQITPYGAVGWATDMKVWRLVV